jgi:hypothetical protein
VNKKQAKAAPVKKVRSAVASKWTKTVVLQRDPQVRKYLPPARMMTEKGLREMLLKWKMVYVKPTLGSLGNGVMKVELNEGKGSGRAARSYSYQLGETRLTFRTYKEAYLSILKSTEGKAYLVQKGIHLLKHKGRPFDIRLVMQQSPRGIWEATGTLGRAAHPLKIVTNGSQGGTIYPTDYLLKPYTSKVKRALMLEQMDKLAINTAKCLHKVYPGIKELGLDLAIDRKLKPWILEVNTRPDPCPFTLLEDQSMLRKIVRYAKAYGKTYRLNCKKAKRGKR